MHIPSKFRDPITTARTEMDRLFSNLFGNDDWNTNTISQGPMSIKMWETDESVCLEADLPGVDKDDVEVTVDGRQLRISAIRHESSLVVTPNPKGVTQPGRERFKEAYYGRIERVVGLPNMVEAESCNAELKRGVLFLTFKKTSDSKVRKIAVK